MKKQTNQLFCAWLLLCAIMTVMSACVRETFDTPGLGKGKFKVDYSFDDIRTMGVSAESAEKKVENAYFVFYNASGGEYVAHQRGDISPDNGGTGSLSLAMPDEVIPGSQYQVLVVGNYDKYKAEGKSFDDYMKANENKSYLQMKQEMYSQNASGHRVVTPLPFSGQLIGADGEPCLLTGPAKDAAILGVSVKFSRAVCRIDLRNLAGEKLVMAWVKVCNYRDQGYLFHSDAPKGNGVIRGLSATPPTEQSFTEGYVRIPAPDNYGKQYLLNGGLYAYPNIVPYVAQDDKLTTCLMIAGYYQKEGAPENTTKLTYYRANVATDKLSQLLKRNYVYTVIVNNVKAAGDDTEDGAMKQTDKLLDYAVGDDWEDDDNNTVVDGKGNYLTLSRSALLLESPKDESAIVKVSVKPGTTWRLVWLENTESAFKFEKVDDTSFRVITLGENATSFTKNARLNVLVNDTELAIAIQITQLSSSDDIRMLTVDGRTGNYALTVPGQGGSMKFQVLTGGANGRWTATADNALSQSVSNLTPSGAHKGYVTIDFMPNATGSARNGSLTIKRDPAVDVPDVVITFNQPTSPYLVSVVPSCSEGVVIEGFNPMLATVPNTVVSTKIFYVTLADPTKYTYKAQIIGDAKFNKNADAYLSLDANQLLSSGYSVNASALDVLQNRPAGTPFYLHVFRTGPGDPDIDFSIKITAVPNAGSGLPEGTYSFNVKITTNCIIDDCIITNRNGSFIVADRNVGALPKSVAPIALNYSNSANHPSKKNGEFKGSYFIQNLAAQNCSSYGALNYTGADASGWVVPTVEQLTSMSGPSMIFSKERGFVVSTVKTTDQRHIGCYFPISGMETTPEAMIGYYWSSTTAATASKYYYQSVQPVGSGITDYLPTGKFTVRCVKKII